jgi:hypothetical protein
MTRWWSESASLDGQAAAAALAAEAAAFGDLVLRSR